MPPLQRSCYFTMLRWQEAGKGLREKHIWSASITCCSRVTGVTKFPSLKNHVRELFWKKQSKACTIKLHALFQNINRMNFMPKIKNTRMVNVHYHLRVLNNSLHRWMNVGKEMQV